MPTVTLNSTATLFAATNEATYAAARERSGVSYYAAEYGWIGQYFGGSYEVSQVFARFDLSLLPANALITSAKLILTVPESYGTHTVEVREVPAFTPGNAAAFIPGSQLAARTLLGTTNFVDAFNITREIALTDFTRAGLANVVLHGLQQRTNVAPTGDTTTRVETAKLEVTYVYAVYLTTAGTGTWVVPADVSSVKVECWGAGGYGNSGSTNAGKWGGGGGAYACLNVLEVTPGAGILYMVGAGGSVNKDTWFVTATTAKAAGAQPAGSGGTAPLGGQASASVGDIKFSGGRGGDAPSSSATGRAGGGGGGAASPAGDGANGVGVGAVFTPGGAGGASPDAGAGGAAGVSPNAGGPGHSNSNGGGGGGGGASSNGAGSGRADGGQGGSPGGGSGGGRNSNNGAPGQIRITWEPSAEEPPAPAARLHRSFCWL